MIIKHYSLVENTSLLISCLENMSIEGFWMRDTLITHLRCVYINRARLCFLWCAFLSTIYDFPFEYICNCTKSAIQILKLIMLIMISIKLISVCELGLFITRLSINLIYIYLFTATLRNRSWIIHLCLSFMPCFESVQENFCRLIFHVYNANLYIFYFIIYPWTHYSANELNWQTNKLVNAIVFISFSLNKDIKSWYRNGKIDIYSVSLIWQVSIEIYTRP